MPGTLKVGGNIIASHTGVEGAGTVTLGNVVLGSNVNINDTVDVQPVYESLGFGFRHQSSYLNEYLISSEAQLNTTGIQDIGQYNPSGPYDVPYVTYYISFTTHPNATRLIIQGDFRGTTTSGTSTTMAFTGYIYYKEGAWSGNSDINNISSPWTQMGYGAAGYGTAVVGVYVTWPIQTRVLSVNGSTTYTFKGRMSGGSGNTIRGYCLSIKEI